MDYVGLHYTALVLNSKSQNGKLCWCISLSICRIELDHQYKAFLANSSNKQALIYLFAEYMANVDITVHHAEGDSDYKICTVACRSAKAGVIAYDTDIFQSSLAIMLRVVSAIAYRRLKLGLQYVFMKLKASLMMNAFNN